jgi:hypothetical protein
MAAVKRLSKTALKFLACVHSKHGTHMYNLKSYYAVLDDNGFVRSGTWPYVYLTDKGAQALRDHKEGKEVSL